MHIGPLFHIAHVIDDLPAAERWYDRVFAPEYMLRRNHSTIEGRDASILIFADFVSTLPEEIQALRDLEAEADSGERLDRDWLAEFGSRSSGEGETGRGARKKPAGRAERSGRTSGLERR